MNRIELFSKKSYAMIALLTILVSLSLDAQQSMSLGALKFVMPSSQVKASSRKLSMKMATTGLSPKFVSKVGGVSFVQTAKPTFKINSFNLGVDKKKNEAYVIINDTIYDIPLEVWELQSIVEYASSEDNAAVTIYGPNESPIQFHEAFIDNLMGLRILQTDLMLVSDPIADLYGIDAFTNKNKAMLPSYGDEDYILSESEKEFYHFWSDDMESSSYNRSYENSCIEYQNLVKTKMDSISANYNSYIFTDYDQPIHIGLDNGNIKFDGEPYYLFVHQDEFLVDTIEMYNEIKNYVDAFINQKNRFKKSSISSVFNESDNQLIYALIKIINEDKDVQKKAITAFELTDYYEYIQSWLTPALFYQSYTLSRVRLVALSKYANSVVKNGSENKRLLKLCREFSEIKNTLSVYYDDPILTAYAKLMYEIAPTEFVAIEKNEIMNSFRDDPILRDIAPWMSLFLYQDSYTVGISEIAAYPQHYDELLIDYMFQNRVPVAEIMIEPSAFFRHNSDIIFNMNPLVFSAAVKVSQWSSFFRFVKQNYKKEWSKFKKKMNSLKYDAPIVQTPIDIDYMEVYGLDY